MIIINNQLAWLINACEIRERFEAIFHFFSTNLIISLYTFPVEIEATRNRNFKLSVSKLIVNFIAIFIGDVYVY